MSADDDVVTGQLDGEESDEGDGDGKRGEEDGKPEEVVSWAAASELSQGVGGEAKAPLPALRQGHLDHRARVEAQQQFVQRSHGFCGFG